MTGIDLIRLFVSATLCGHLLILASEIPYLLYYFIYGTIERHSVPIFSLRKLVPSRLGKNLVFILGTIVFIGFIGKAGIVFQRYYASYARSHSDLLYGVWDSQTPTRTLGTYRLDSIGIVPYKSTALLSLLTTD